MLQVTLVISMGESNPEEDVVAIDEPPLKLVDRNWGMQGNPHKEYLEALLE